MKWYSQTNYNQSRLIVTMNYINRIKEGYIKQTTDSTVYFIAQQSFLWTSNFCLGYVRRADTGDYTNAARPAFWIFAGSSAFSAPTRLSSSALVSSPSWSPLDGSRTCLKTGNSWSMYGPKTLVCVRNRWKIARKTGRFSRKSCFNGIAPKRTGKT